MPNLIPEKRTDRNGKTVTRHVRNVASPSAATLPPPSVGTAVNGFAPTEAQTQEWKKELPRDAFRSSRALEELLKPKFHVISVTTNDVNIYGMLSILKVGDTLTLMERGIDTADKALLFLRKRGLEDILVNREEFAREALNRRIPAQAYLSLCDRFRTHDADLRRVLDAAEVLGMEESELDEGFISSVMAGEINLSDIKTVGLPLLSQYRYTNDVTRYLRDIKQGVVEFDASHLRQFIERSVSEDVTLDQQVTFVHRFGLERLSQVNNVEAACSMMTHLGNDFRDDLDGAFARVRYYEQMAAICKDKVRAGENTSWRDLPYSTVIKMYEAGIDPMTAVGCYRDNISVSQYIAMKDHGIAPSVSGGWL